MIEIHSSFAIHPGQWLKSEIVDARPIAMNDLARALGASRQAVSNLLLGRSSLSPRMAIKFERAFGIKAETLMRMKARYELAKARQHEADLVVKSLIAA